MLLASTRSCGIRAAPLLPLIPPSSTYTGPHSINSRGEIAGTFSHGLEPTKGFVRHANGNFSVFSVPGSFGTTAHQINYQGFVTGWWKPASNSYQAQGYTRDPVGNFTTFTSPDGQDGATYPMSINASGEVTGYGIQGLSAITILDLSNSDRQHRSISASTTASGIRNP